MTISNELFSDIAAALLSAENRSGRDLNELKEVLCTVHSTLQQMTKDQRDRSKSSSDDVMKSDGASA